MKLRHAFGPLLMLTLGASAVPLFAAQEAATGLDNTTVDEGFVPQTTRDRFRINFDEVDTTEPDKDTGKPGPLDRSTTLSRVANVTRTRCPGQAVK
jgi:hypothetical protein